MKIEKGKLYYDKENKEVRKAHTDLYDDNGIYFTDKIAVHCINNDDFDYVDRKFNLSDDIKEWYYVYNDICISLLNKGWFLKGSALHTDQKYHIITIEEFKKFYPEKEQQPIHFTISPEDYSEYQDLKKLKETLKKLIL